MNSVGQTLENFLSQIDQLEQQYGYEEVLSTLESLLPDFDRSLSTPRETLEPLMEAEGGRVGKLWRSLKDFFSKKGVETGAVGTTTGVGGIGLGTMLGKGVDQDVSIDDITTDKALNIRSDSLERTLADLLADTNDAIKKMTQTLLQTQQQLSGKLDSIDTSVDDSIAAETGETASQVQIRQRAGLKEPLKRKKKEQGKEEKSPGTTDRQSV